MDTQTLKTIQIESEEFLAGLGRTLSRTNLYPFDHPLVKESIASSFAHLDAVFFRENELTISWTGEKILADETPLSGLGQLSNILGGLFEKNNLHSLTFQKGVSPEELAAFYRFLSAARTGLTDAGDLRTFLTTEKIERIKVDIAFFAKVAGRKPEESEKNAGAATATAPEPEQKRLDLIQKLEQMPLESALWEIVQKAAPNPEDQKKIYEIIIGQITRELNSRVESATHQLRSEKQEISNNQQRTESVVGTIAQGVVMVDEKGEIVMMNPAAEKIYGASFTELRGKKILEISKEEVMIALAKEIANTPEKEIPKEVLIESQEFTKDVLTGSTSVIQNPEGKIVGIMSTLQDLAKMRELQRMQNDFVSNVTHELRSPLTAIKAALGALMSEEDRALHPHEAQILSIANRNIDRLARLINDLLDFGKMEAGKITLNLKPVETYPLLAEVVESLQSWALSKRVTIELHAVEKLPKLTADHDRLVQVLVNLVSNAIKFTSSGGKIVVQAETSGSLYVKISVSNDGPGISKEDQEQLFQKFFQLKQTEKTTTPGTGLGLYIAKSIVDLHRGQIGLKSAEGQGATFYFTVPIAVEEIQKSAPSEVKTDQKKSWFARLFGK